MPKSISLHIVVAMSENRVIGNNNSLPWHLPIDLKHFKNLTWGMPIIMGKNTYQSLPKQLEGRYSIVLSSTLSKYQTHHAWVCNTIENAMEYVSTTLHCKEAFIIGGAMLYESILHKVSNIYLTRIEANCEGDKFFPKLEKSNWKLVNTITYIKDEKNLYNCNFEYWKKIK